MTNERASFAKVASGVHTTQHDRAGLCTFVDDDAAGQRRQAEFFNQLVGYLSGMMIAPNGYGFTAPH